MSNEPERKGSVRESTDCTLCSKGYIDSKKIIQCSRCQGHFCINCTQMTQTKMNYLKDPSGGIMWFCATCQPAAAKSVKTDRDIEERCKEYWDKWEKKLDEIQQELKNKADKNDVDNLSAEVDKLNVAVNSKLDKTDLVQFSNELSSIKNQTKDFKQELKQVVEQEMEDWKEMERRKSNIMIYGIEESEAATNSTDEQKVRDYLDKQIEVPDVRIVKMYRVGRKKSLATDQAADRTNTRPRLIKVILASNSERNKVMKSYREKKNNQVELDYGISGDYTKSETEKYQKLKEEIKRREATGEKDLVIRRSKIVKKRT